MSNILNDLGIDEDDLDWFHLAICRGMDTNLFYEKYESDANVARNIDEMCFSCPVMKMCYESGVDNNEYGVWGGVYLSSGSIDRSKNLHKTVEKPVFYTEEMRKAVHQVKKPPMLLMDIVMYPEFLALRLYEDNFLQFEGTKKEMVIDYVGKIKRLLESYGVRCELEGKPSERIL